MNHQPLGRSGLFVSCLSLGTMLFGEDSERTTPEADALSMVDRFLERGGSHIDCANVYASGRSETIVGNAIAGRRDKVTIATKARFGTEPTVALGSGLSRKVVMDQVHQSLRRLKTDYLDLYYMHGWDPQTPIEESLRAYDDLVRDGKVRYLGVSNFRAWQVMKALGVSDARGQSRFVAGQFQYSLITRDIEPEYASLFQAEGLGGLAWGPLGQGLLSGKYQRNKPVQGRIAQSDETVEESPSRRFTETNWRILEAVQAIAVAHNATPSQIALAWVMAQPFMTSAIIGPRTLPQLEDNLGAIDIVLSAEELAMLTDVSQPEPGYPYRMMDAYGMS